VIVAWIRAEKGSLRTAEDASLRLAASPGSLASRRQSRLITPIPQPRKRGGKGEQEQVQ